MHLDPCEGIYDNPLLYEKGWNKKLSYVIGISKDGARDVTKRYTRKWQDVLSRRYIVEAAVSATLSDIRFECRRGYSREAVSVLESRDRIEEDELNNYALHHHSENSISLPGRQSGSMDWRSSRSELGSSESWSLSSTSCPLRMCVDSHVRGIFNSLAHLLADFQSNGFLTSTVVFYVKKLRKAVKDLKSSSFKARQAAIDLTSEDSEFIKKTVSSLGEFLSALSLKKDDLDQKICISLAGNPVQTSVALPVALDALDEIIENLESHGQFEQKFISTFSRFNRISSGMVIASGEELPFGISTSAFDGSHSYKWEDPNGAKGCWLVYKIIDGKKQDLVAYELMSANDAPERDPKDWIVEGSEDGGSSWFILDQQLSQIFEKRMQRKRFEVQLGRPSNAFRFRFLTVRDPNVQSRFQIGCIDLYARDATS